MTVFECHFFVLINLVVLFNFKNRWRRQPYIVNNGVGVGRLVRQQGFWGMFLFLYLLASYKPIPLSIVLVVYKS